MTIGIIVIPALVLLATTMIARLLELQNDVLYGPYVAGRKNPVVRFRDEAGEILESLGLRRGPATPRPENRHPRRLCVGDHWLKP